jgi:uncharacterized protein
MPTEPVMPADSVMAIEPAPAALAVLAMAQAGHFDEIRDRFAPQLQPMVSAEALRAAWDAQTARYGRVMSVGVPVSEAAGPATVAVKIPVTFENGELALIVAIDTTGSLAGLQLAPASAAQPIQPWEAPGYVDPSTFDEQDVTVGSGPLAVPGTLSLPHRSEPGPAIVLLAGSGPADRDATMGRNKPLKDIAWGLASRGIAVLRFDKVTYARREEVARRADFTLVDEYVYDAVAAVNLLAAQSSVDATSIFVLGHSLGGTVAPRVAGTEPSVAGLVILAGGTQPLHWSAVRQMRYLASLDPAAAAASQPAIDTLTKQAAVADSPDLSPSTPASDLPFGVPAPYWLDLRAYDPVAAAASLGIPMLILQGARDYQATVNDDLAAWQTGLADRDGVTIRIYDHDDHLFFTGTGPSSPAEYEPAQHVDATVVDEIATWLSSAAARG